MKKETIKIITFRPDSPQSAPKEVLEALDQQTNSKLIAVRSWDELSSTLTINPDILLFHTKISKSFHVSLSEFVQMMKSLIRCIPECTKDVRMGAIISKSTTQEEIAELKKLGIAGILPNTEEYGFLQRAAAQIEIMKGNEYWPEDVISSLPRSDKNIKKTILLFQPDRYTKRFNSEAADAYFEEHVPCNFLVATTWGDFVNKLNHNPNMVGFHSDLFNNEELSTQILIKTIETTLKLQNKQADIFVAVNKKANRDIINVLRKTSIIGLQFGRGDFGIEYAAESYRRLLEDRQHWPEDKIASLLEFQENKTPLHVYFRDDIDSYIKFDPELNKKIKAGLNIKIQLCKSWSDLSSVLQENPKNITFHIDMVRRHGGTISEFMLMLETMIKYANLNIRPNVSVGIEADTHISTIKELQKHKILGIAPSAKSFGIEYTRNAIKDLLNDMPHWPKDVIARLPGNEPKVKNKNAHSLTGRQQEVFDLIAKRGLSNKQIARVLNISESTVKIHVSAVMKNLCVRNRTQLALTK